MQRFIKYNQNKEREAIKIVKSAKSLDYKKNTISRLFAIQALFQMEANGKSYSIIKKELKEKFYMQQIQVAEYLKPNYLMVQKIIEQASKNQIKIDAKINMAFNNLWNLKTIDTTLRAILRAASAEFINKKTPKKVIMSEYVSITGTFYLNGQEQRLVNGLLNKIIEDL